ncbi:MAG: SDR family oxidoreductase [Acidimicrobiales bacterium]|nr:SDR family oxidoreductase [Acidimicrobiales bacterium]HRW39155.1 SDR family oxidoreductase [Aquihabitans sp.]
MAAPRIDLAGQVVIVTGANSGIGFETALALAEGGATVVMAGRSEAKVARAVEEVAERTGSTRVVAGALDLASFASIRSFAAWFLDEFDRLDVLVNNAGLVLDERRETEEGFEQMFGVNHLGHFLLTDLLRERLVASAPARVINVASVAHRAARRGMTRDDLQHERRFRSFAVYGESKLANVLFTRELARRLDGTGVIVHCVHPGSINSGFGADGDAAVLGSLIALLGRVVLRSPRFGARTQVWLASTDDPAVVGTTGGYFSWKRRWRPSRAARRPDEARWLWEQSERLIAAAS